MKPTEIFSVVLVAAGMLAALLAPQMFDFLPPSARQQLTPVALVSVLVACFAIRPRLHHHGSDGVHADPHSVHRRHVAWRVHGALWALWLVGTGATTGVLVARAAHLVPLPPSAVAWWAHALRFELVAAVCLHVAFRLVEHSVHEPILHINRSDHMEQHGITEPTWHSNRVVVPESGRVRLEVEALVGHNIFVSVSEGDHHDPRYLHYQKESHEYADTAAAS